MLGKLLGNKDISRKTAKIDAINRSQAVIEFDLNGNILDVNDNFLKALGYQRDEIISKHHSMFVEPDYARSLEYKQFWQTLRSGEFQAAEYKRIGKGGKEVWIQASYNPLLNRKGEPEGVVKFATDTTEQKLRSADYEGQVKAIGKSQAVIEFNLDGKVLDANENFLKTLGYQLDEIVGKHHSMFVDPDYARSRDYEEFWRALRNGEFQAAEYRRLGKGGKEVWIQASYNPIYDPSGRLFKVVKYATDITEQVQKRQIGAEVDANFSAMSAALDGISQQTTRAATAASQTSSSVQTVAAAAEELSSSIREISSSITGTTQAVTQASSEVEAADRNTSRLSESASAMTGIIEFIQDIASNINLLALNATIESARAGEAGKGFAVVASEVKSLATQVAQASEKISGEISGMQEISGSVVKALRQIREAMSQVQSSVTGVAGAVEEQATVTSEISANMQMTATATENVEASLKEIMHAATEVTRTCEDLHGKLQVALG